MMSFVSRAFSSTFTCFSSRRMFHFKEFSAAFISRVSRRSCSTFALSASALRRSALLTRCRGPVGLSVTCLDFFTLLWAASPPRLAADGDVFCEPTLGTCRGTTGFLAGNSAFFGWLAGFSAAAAGAGALFGRVTAEVAFPLTKVADTAAGLRGATPALGAGAGAAATLGDGLSPATCTGAAAFSGVVEGPLRNPAATKRAVMPLMGGEGGESGLRCVALEKGANWASASGRTGESMPEEAPSPLTGDDKLACDAMGSTATSWSRTLQYLRASLTHRHNSLATGSSPIASELTSLIIVSAAAAFTAGNLPPSTAYGNRRNALMK
mmetsp:Transcript_20154/g.36490  ORF Transcript_20154/g.36490 Transcript_20154/m.36490 type:complete len:324 (+) Transcript_20154:574-1545(+)